MIDEAQDILRSNYVDSLEPLLVGGIGGGTWRLFGDFVNQAIYGAPESPRDLLERRCPAESPTTTLRRTAAILHSLLSNSL